MYVCVCKQSKNKFVFIVCFILCATVQTCNTYTRLHVYVYNYSNNYSFVILFTTISYSAYNLFVSCNTYALDLYSEGLWTITVLFTRNFTQGWLNYYLLSFALSWPFIVQDNQYNKHFWSRTFLFSPSRELYCDFIFICV